MSATLFLTLVLSSCYLEIESSNSKSILKSRGVWAKQKLIHNLMIDYNPDIEPDNVSLGFRLSIYCARMDEASRELTTNAVENYFWTDQRLAWDPKVYGDIDILRLPITSVWRPDVKLSYSSQGDEKRSETLVILNSDGTLVWQPPVVYKTLCFKENNSWNCTMEIGSWMYDAMTLDLKLDEGGVDLIYYNNATCPLLVGNPSAKMVTVSYLGLNQLFFSNVIINLNPGPNMG